MRAVVVELEKLRTVRSTWVVVALAVLSPVPLAVLALALRQRIDAQSADDALGWIAIPAILVAALAAAACAREFELRTITTVFTLEPRRERVLAAKAAAAALVGAGVGALAMAISVGITSIWMSSVGVPWPWTAGETAQGILGAVAIVALVAVAGVGFGAAVRHAGGAVSALVVLYVVVDPTIGSQIEWYRDHGIIAAAVALCEPATPHALGWLTALGILVASSALVLAIGMSVVRRTDV